MLHEIPYFLFPPFNIKNQCRGMNISDEIILFGKNSVEYGSKQDYIDPL